MEGRQVLMFWYRNEIYAIEARSPAEGAYSEGFIRAKFTQVGSRCSAAACGGLCGCPCAGCCVPFCRFSLAVVREGYAMHVQAPM